MKPYKRIFKENDSFKQDFYMSTPKDVQIESWICQFLDSLGLNAEGYLARGVKGKFLNYIFYKIQDIDGIVDDQNPEQYISDKIHERFPQYVVSTCFVKYSWTSGIKDLQISLMNL